MNKKGFTLIELLVVIAIIGLLSTLAVVALGSVREKGRDTKRVADLKQVSTALELYYTENSAYPTAAEAITLGGDLTACLNASGFSGTGCSDAFMGLVPSDPGDSSYLYTSTDGTTFTITAVLEGTVNDMSGTVEATPSGIAEQGA